MGKIKPFQSGEKNSSDHVTPSPKPSIGKRKKFEFLAMADKAQRFLVLVDIAPQWPLHPRHAPLSAP